MRSPFAHASAKRDSAQPTDPELARLLTDMRPPKGIVAVSILRRGEQPRIASTGRAPDRELFEIGSVTKTITATALAQLVVDGQLRLEATVGEILGERAGNASRITLLELATHTSGMPKLAPNALTLPFWPRDPYRFYDSRRLWRGLAAVALKDAGNFAYSNVAFTLLGVCLAEATHTTIDELLTEAVLRPAGMATARCQPCPRRGLVHGHGHWLTGGRRWHQPLPGPGGIDGTIADLAAWAAANLHPDSTPLGEAVRLAQQAHHEDGDTAVGLAWIKTKGTTWHNGATGGFSSFIGIREDGAVCALASHTQTPTFNLDAPAAAYLAGKD